MYYDEYCYWAQVVVLLMCLDFDVDWDRLYKGDVFG